MKHSNILDQLQEKKLNLNLIESIILTDFFIVNKINKNIVPNSIKNINFNNKNTILLNVFKLHKEIKQLMRIFYFLSSKKFNNSTYFLLFCKNDQKFFLLKTYLNKYLSNFKFFVSQRYNDFSVDQEKKIKMLFSFQDFKNDNVEKNLFFLKYLLIGETSLKQGIFKNSSFYKINNKFDTYKKILFFISCLETIFKKI
jgi:hypothetical protein